MITGATAASSLLLQSGVLFALAIGGYAASFAINLTRRRLWQEAAADLELQPAELPMEGSIEDPAAKRLLARLTNARAERVAVLRNVDPALTGRTRTLAARAAELERNAVCLLQGLDRLGTHAGHPTVLGLRSELARLQQASAGAPPAARLEAERATATLRARLDAIAQIERWQALVTARLESLVGALEALPSRLARADVWQGTLRALQDDAPLASLREELENLDAAAQATFEGEASDLPPPRPAPTLHLDA